MAADARSMVDYATDPPYTEHMQHFAIVQALCRAAMAHPTPAIKQQIERLCNALNAGGEAGQAKSLSNLISEKTRSAHEMSPTRVVQAQSILVGEALTLKTPLPVDKETAAPLVDVIYPDQLRSDPPQFNASVKQAVQGILSEWRHIEELSKLGIHPPRTCLIYGPPGTGKTRLALWLAKMLGVPVVVARLDSLVSSFLGTSARNIGNLFAFANRYKCILLLDEFDALAKLRDDPQEVGEIKRVVNSLLQNLDQRQPFGVTIGITNHPQLLDKAVWRRFEVQIEIPFPDKGTRREILKDLLADLSISDPEIDLMSWAAESSSGADLETMARYYRRYKAIPSNDLRGLISALNQYITLNSGRISQQVKLAFEKDEVEFLQFLKNELAFNYSDLSLLDGRDRSTIARQISKER